MEIKDARIDGGKPFDWGRTAADYARYRDIYPLEFYRAILDRGVGLAGQQVLDIGTGSGILAIAALKLGAAEAEGVDIDPMCVRTAGENAERNGVAEHFTVLVGDLSDKASGKYNIITANIVAAAILSLAPHVPVLMAPGARFIASGIIDTRKDEVLAGLRAAGLEPVEIKEKRGWVCVICKNAAEV